MIMVKSSRQKVPVVFIRNRHAYCYSYVHPYTDWFKLDCYQYMKIVAHNYDISFTTWLYKFHKKGKFKQPNSTTKGIGAL